MPPDYYFHQAPETILTVLKLGEERQRIRAQQWEQEEP